MAQSPSPGAPTLPSALHNARRTSASPPSSQQQPLSKRDKRRTMIDQRLKDIATSFTSNRDLHLRNQLNVLSRDMQYITRAELYSGAFLDDGVEEVGTDMMTQEADFRSSIPGSSAAVFVERINDQMELRDAALTDIDIAFKKQLENLKLDFRFAAEVAESECKGLKDAARNRVTSSIQQKKKQIQKEKDQLDTADSSVLMNSHALTAITAPGSPGGFQSNRKTRHTRHRQDQEALETPDIQRRKRKAPADTEFDSPAPMLRTNSIDAFGTLLWDRSRTGAEIEHSSTTPSVEQFFNSRELATHNRSAMTTVAQSWTDKRARRANYNGKSHLGEFHGNGDISDIDQRGNHNPSDDDADLEDVSSLVAPMMDRNGSHATRSARINQLEILAHRDNIEDGDDPRRSYGIAVLDASLARSKVAQSRDMEAPMTTGMSQQDISDDLSIMQSLLDDD